MLSAGLPSTRKAIIQDAAGRPIYDEKVPMPTSLDPGMVLIKTAAVAMNPSDYKLSAAFPSPGAIVGIDFAGTVVALDQGVRDIKPDLGIGDFVCGASHAGIAGHGAFAQYVVAHAGMLMQIPQEDGGTTIPTEHAATLATALATCTLAFWGPGQDSLHLEGTPLAPLTAPLPVLVYGGSTATGTIAIQLLRLSGYDPIATCSPHNFSLCKSRGASAVFDYKPRDVGIQIKTHTKNRLKAVIDCISDEQSVETCFSALARVGGRYVSLEFVPEELLSRRKAVKTGFVLAYEISGQGTKLGGSYNKEADPKKLELGIRYFSLFEGLLRDRRLVTHPVQSLNSVGLQEVLQGLKMLQGGTISGKKLVVQLF
ncbi:hypothetical protein NUW58_g4731 [Xylaria curta]|uniref:Uncharacterized protein n=1 Tax=Xylaria curta TaxID=42375 RepID=A0ACC1P5W8_9PEZI|nr:hypothetical protein NUW58_g4731 [Xylaria curta]